MPRETKKPQQPKDASDLPQLTPKQLAFVQGILQGMTASDAYRHAYNAENMASNAIWTNAAKLKADTKVALWLQRAAAENLVECKVTLDNHTAELDRLSRLAETAGAYGASIKAQELRGRANGLYVDQIKTDTGQADVLQALAAIGKVDPRLAKELGERLGLPESDTIGSDGDDKPVTH